MRVGTSVVRATKMSTRTARPRPSPNIFTKVIPPVATAKNVIDSTRAAAVTIWKVVATPPTIAWWSSAPRSCSSLIRDSRKTSSSLERPKAIGHQDGHRRVGAAGGGDVEEAGEVAVPEDPDHRSERRREARRVEHDRLEGREEAAEHEEQHDEGRDGDPPTGPRREREDRGLRVDELRGGSAPNSSRIRSVATRAGSSLGSTRASGLPNSMPRKGVPAWNSSRRISAACGDSDARSSPPPPARHPTTPTPRIAATATTTREPNRTSRPTWSEPNPTWQVGIRGRRVARR
jgi:hypothetical protein